MRVFISHSRQNSGAALKLYDELKQRGVTSWLDLRELDLGSNWNERVAEAIRSCQAFVFFIGSSDSTSDQGQRFEWKQVVDQEYYLDPSKPLIPVVVGDAEIPGFLKARKAIRVDESSLNIGAIADAVLIGLSEPLDTIDQESLERGRVARKQALDNLRQYSISLEQREAKQAGLDALK